MGRGEVCLKGLEAISCSLYLSKGWSLEYSQDKNGTLIKVEEVD